MEYKRFLSSCIALIILMPVVAWAQNPNGPGGIFSLTGTSNLKGWFEARDLNGDNIFTNNPANGTAVSAWNDKSSSANHLSQTTASNQPSYNTGGTFPAVSFTFSTTANESDVMSFAAANHYVPGSAYFVLLATDPGATLQDHILLEDGTRSLRLEQFSNTGNMGYTRYSVNDYVTTQGTTYGAYTIVSYHKPAAGNNVTIRQNNASASLNIGSSTDGIPMTRIGKNATVEGANYNMVEVIVFGTVLNSTQIVIVDNYLSSKYGNITIASDLYGMDAAGSGNHDYDVAGIGRVSGTDNHQDAQSSILRINTPSNLGNGEYLLWGHNNGALTPQTSDLPTGVQARLTRTWGVSEQAGDVGTVTLLFDLTNMGAVTPGDLRLLIDTDNDGIFGEASTTVSAVTATLFSGSTYQFAGVNLANNTRVTLGTIDRTQTPLPVELEHFTAKHESDAVNLYWTTASEKNNDYFEVTRSTDGRTYQPIDTVQGAGNSATPKQYQARDNFPPAGLTFYRLRQVDFDGAFSYSPVVQVDIPQQPLTVEVYPTNTRANAAIQLTLANYTRDETLYGAAYTLVDVAGRSLQLTAEKITDTTHRLFIPNDCTPGIYILKVMLNNVLYTRRIRVY